MKSRCGICLVTILLCGIGAARPVKVYADEPQPSPPSIAIDAAKTGTPISKYIYGQFIEHLGHCIYGGIWAEMLEDRKFFDAVGAEQSPWRAVGMAKNVKMDGPRAFVGAHSPKITLAGNGALGGIVQGKLALRKGMQYVGRMWLAGDAQVGPVTVALIWGDAPNQRQSITIKQITPEYAKTPLEFTAAADTDQGRFEITATGAGAFYVGTASLMPADNVHGMRADTLALLEQLDAPVYRWPGGNFVSGYNWRDGIGNPDFRPPRKNPAWTGIEHNDFGLDEFMIFCRLLKTEPYIAVNSGLGDVSSAADEVRYANAAADTAVGRLRAHNGHPAPYGVKWWSVGNEMYGDWQLGHMPLEEYVKKHNIFAQAMREADPRIKLIGVGLVGDWTKTMFQHCNGHMDLISEHFYCKETPDDLPAYVRQIGDNVRRIADAHRQYQKELPELKGKRIPIALDEWNYWYGPDVYGELGVRYYLRDALGIAAGLNEYTRQSDVIFMANYAQTVNVIGCIKATKAAAALESTGLALMLYRKHFGVIPVAVKTCGVIDVAAAWTADRKQLTIAIVNPTLQKCDIPLCISGTTLTGKGNRWQIAGTDPMAYNAPGKKPALVIEETPVDKVGACLSAAPCSVTLLALDVK